MKANTTVQRIYNLFQHPSKRFTDAVGAIADQHITEYHAENGNGYTEAEIIAIVQAAIAEQEHPIVPTDAITYGGNIDSPDDTVLTAENVGKIFNIANSFTVEPGDQRFVDTFEVATAFPAGSNAIVVDASTTDDPEPVYKFDILHGLVTSGNGASLLRYEAFGPTLTVEEGINLKDNLVSAHAYVQCTTAEEEVFSGWADGLCSVNVEEHTLEVSPLPNAMSMLFTEIPDGATIEVKQLKVFVQPS